MEPKSASRWPLYIVLALLIIVSAVFVVVFITASEVKPDTSAASDQLAASYADRVAGLLANADPVRGEALISQLECAACHIAASSVGVAPSFDGVATRAETRRPPLTAAEYIYESITHPTAFVVSGFSGSMPQNFAERLSDEQLGDIMAYLLTLK